MEMMTPFSPPTSPSPVAPGPTVLSTAGKIPFSLSLATAPFFPSRISTGEDEVCPESSDDDVEEPSAAVPPATYRDVGRPHPHPPTSDGRLPTKICNTPVAVATTQT